MLNSNRRPRIPNEQWTLHKATIRHLYLDDDRALEGDGGVIDVMEKEHNFFASKSQYERKFKEWGYRKYLRREDWEALAAAQDARKAEGKDSKISVNGYHLKPEKIRKELRRVRGKPSHRACEARGRRLPTIVAIRSPSPMEMPSPRRMSPDIGFEHEPFDPDLLLQIDVDLPKVPADTVSHSVVETTSDPLLPSSDLEDLQFPREEFNWASPNCLLPFSPLANGPCNVGGQNWFSPNFLSPNDFGPIESVLGHMPTPLDHLYTDSGEQSILSDQAMLGLNFSDTFPGFASLRFNDAKLHDLDIRFGSLSLLELESTLRFPSAEILQLRQRIDLDDLPDRTVMDSRSCDMLHSRGVDAMLTYFVASILINNDSPLDRLYDDSQPLNSVFRVGIHYIHSVSAGRLNDLLSSFPAHLAESMSYNLVGTAIELDSRRTVEALLERNDMAIKDVYCTVGGKCYTPIERCFLLRHIELAQILITHGCDLSVNVSDENILALCLDWKRKSRTFLSVELEVFKTLLDRGITSRRYNLIHITGLTDSRVAETFVAHFRGNRKELLIHNGFMTSALKNLDNGPATKIVRLILGGQFNKDGLKSRPDVAEVLSVGLSNAAYRHNYASIDLLLAAGARPTSSCLENAVRSKNLQAVERFLDLDVDPNAREKRQHVQDECNSDEHTTAVAIAIRDQYSEALHLFGQRRFLDRIAESADGAVCALDAAISVGNENLARSILSRVDFDTFDSFRGFLPSLLDKAIEGRNATLISRLIQAGIQPTMIQLEKASRVKDAQIMTIVLDAYIPFVSNDTEDVDNGTLFDLMLHGEMELIKKLILCGVRLDIPHSMRELFSNDPLPMPEICSKSAEQLLQWYKIRRCDPLTYAIFRGHQNVVDLFIEQGASPRYLTGQMRDHTPHVDNVSPRIFFGPLSAAVIQHHATLVQRLLAIGAEPADDLALLLAVQDSNLDLVEILIKAFKQRYGEKNQFYGILALCVAIENDDVCLIEILVQVVDIHHTACHGTTWENYTKPRPHLSPLGKAITTNGKNRPAIIRHLLDSGVNPNSIVREAGTCRETALLVAIETGDLTIVEVIVKAGARCNVTERPRHGVPRTPLQRASELGNKELVQYLLDRGATPNESCAMNGATALQLAAQKGFCGIAEILLGQANVNAEAAPFGGRTAFEGATENGKIDMMVLLVKHGADLLANDSKQYKRALKLAEKNKQKGAQTLAKLLYQEQLSRAARLA